MGFEKDGRASRRLHVGHDTQQAPCHASIVLQVDRLMREAKRAGHEGRKHGQDGAAPRAPVPVASRTLEKVGHHGAAVTSQRALLRHRGRLH